MNSYGSGTVLGLSDPPHVAETALFSFNPLVYLYFLVSFFLVPYPLYRCVASRLCWELNSKTVARHWSDGMLGCCVYGLNLFVFGNYTHGFSWITVVAFYPSLFLYGWIAERPFAKTSLPNIRHWSAGMWLLFLGAVLIILACAAYHIYVASTLSFPFVIYYVAGLLIPISILMMAKLLTTQVNTHWIQTTYHHWSNRVSHRPNKVIMQVEEDLPGLTTPSRVSLHLHHWQIFYILAYFTRFTDPLSQVSAGIVLACYMEGVAAYGYDHLVNDD